MVLVEQLKAWGEGFVRENKLFAAVLVLALFGLAYYFPVTAQQALWFDEADYLNFGRFFVFGNPEWALNAVRPPLFPLITSFFFWVGWGEVTLRFFLLGFYVANMFLMYALTKSLFGKVAGVVSTFFLGVYWSYLFFTFRLLVDVPMVTFWLLALFFFVRGYMQGAKRWYLWALFPTMFIGFLMKYTSAVVLGIVLAFLLLTEGFAFVRRKDLWISGGIVLVLLIPFLFWQYSTYGHPLAFLVKAMVQQGEVHKGVIESVIYFERGGLTSTGFWNSLVDHAKFLFVLPGKVALFVFLGALVLLLDFVLGLDMIVRRTGGVGGAWKGKLLVLLWLVFVLMFAGRIGHGPYIEERYFFNLNVGMFVVIGYGVGRAYEKVKGYNTHLAALLVIGILAGAAYENLPLADATIKMKAESFKQVKEAGAWLNQHLAEDERFWSQGTSAEMQYHANRRNVGPGYDIHAIMNETKLKYFVWSAFNQLSPETIELPQKYPEVFRPVQVFTIDGKNPIIVIFEIQRGNKTKNV